jgi:glycosyltransferase involved in cell wall biosynthesis
MTGVVSSPWTLPDPPGSGAPEPSDELELTILMPCLNEAETVATCVGKARDFLARRGVRGEVLVADNGSTDNSRRLAREAGARVVLVPSRGNGAALHGGISAARGRYVIMGDADDSYDFLALAHFLDGLRDGADLVMGNRFQGGIQPGAMPPLHQHFGNPMFSKMGQVLFGSKVGDFHCGLRGFRRDKFDGLGMAALGFEFCSEMIIKATFAGWNITEVPTKLYPDGRSRAPHLRTWRDGFRHLRFFLLYSPRWLFLVPGLVAMLLGFGIGTAVTAAVNGLKIGSLNLDIDTLVIAAGLIIVGFQAVLFAVLTKLYASAEGFLPGGRWTTRARQFRLTTGLLISAVLLVGGVVGVFASIWNWRSSGFGNVSPRHELRIVIPSITAMVLGVQLAFGSFFASILGIKHGTPRLDVVDATERDPQFEPA